MGALGDLAAIAHQPWREDAACAGAYKRGDEFVDVVDHDKARHLIARYCTGCRVVRPCRELADSNAPYRLFGYVAGARFYQRGEPRDGWEVAS